ncbi:MAG: hypothetical protein QNJ77_10390 [Acidimicrobiia bacterium]|nr:hypothetical protein [Acidimicrobiia bacterium]
MSDYATIRQSAAAIADRTGLVWVGGVDAVSYLEGLLSQNISGIAPGDGARSLLLGPNGKLRALLWVLRTEDRVGLLCDRGVVDTLMEDLARYRIRVDVSLQSEDRSIWEVWGPRAADAVADLAATGPDTAAPLVAAYPLQRSLLPRYLAVGGRPHAPAANPDQLEVVRIEEGEAIMGVDLTDKTIPQEGVDVASAVDFTKGCYLGQELVARIDSRGHVNRRLTGFVFAEGTFPASGSVVSVADRDVGELTSVAQRPGGAVALGMLRVEVPEEATVSTAAGVGTVSALPIVG